MIAIQLNGKERQLAGPVTLQDLLREIASPMTIAVAINSEVIPHSEFERVQVRDRDRVEIIHAVGGG